MHVQLRSLLWVGLKLHQLCLAVRPQQLDLELWLHLPRRHCGQRCFMSRLLVPLCQLLDDPVDVQLLPTRVLLGPANVDLCADLFLGNCID